LRHDLKQIMMGLAVTPEGLPAFGQVLNGNQNDGKWYPTVIDKLRSLMSPEKLADVIFVAGAALVNENNLKAMADFIKQQKAPFGLAGTVEMEETVKHARRGRPAKDAAPVVTSKYFARIQVLEADQSFMEHEKADASTFLLITNLLDDRQYTDEEILKEYKEQGSVEKQFRFLKSPFLVGPIYLKNKSRVEALAYVFLFALLVATHLELRVREALKNRGELLQHPDKRKIANPTAAMLLELLASIRVVRLGEQRAIAKPVGPHVKRILELTGFDETIYTVVPSFK